MKKEIIRSANIKDLDRILEIENHSFSTPWSREALRMEIEENELAEVFVIEDNLDVVGYMSYIRIVDEAHINNIAIDNKYRAKGYGRKLVSKIVEDLLNSNYSITLEVRHDNDIAINLYKSLGFKEAGIRKDYYAVGADALIMWIRR